tara:strand:- start:20 stop:256 length:237 start_codon:yes stop_codon:yes gene_type:complete
MDCVNRWLLSTTQGQCGFEPNPLSTTLRKRIEGMHRALWPDHSSTIEEKLQDLSEELKLPLEKYQFDKFIELLDEPLD